MEEGDIGIERKRDGRRRQRGVGRRERVCMLCGTSVLHTPQHSWCSVCVCHEAVGVCGCSQKSVCVSVRMLCVCVFAQLF